MNAAEHLIMVLIALSVTAAYAKLPPPTAEQQAAEAKKKEQQQAQLEKEKKLLEQAQDRIAQRYRKDKGGAPAAGGNIPDTKAENMPKTTKELPGGVGPKPTQPQSGEAHSGSAK
jgi:hypothetical protein